MDSEEMKLVTPPTNGEEKADAKEDNRMFAHPFSFKGQIGFPEYLLTFIITCAIFCIKFLIDVESEEGLVYAALCIAAIYFLIAQGTKRCHDLGNNGWGQILPTYQLVMLFFEGEKDKDEASSKEEQNNKVEDDEKTMMSQPTVAPTPDTDTTVTESIQDDEVTVLAQPTTPPTPKTNITITKEESPQKAANKLTITCILFAIGGLLEFFALYVCYTFPSLSGYIPSWLLPEEGASLWVKGIVYAKQVSYLLLGIYAFFTVYSLWARKNKAMVNAILYTAASAILYFGATALFFYAIVLAIVLWQVAGAKDSLKDCKPQNNTIVNWCIPTSILFIALVLIFGFGTNTFQHVFSQKTENRIMEEYPSGHMEFPEETPTFTQDDCGEGEFTDGNVIYTIPNEKWEVLDTTINELRHLVFTKEDSHDFSQLDVFSAPGATTLTTQDINQLWIALTDTTIKNPEETYIKTETISEGEVQGFRKTAKIKSDLPTIVYRDLVFLCNSEANVTVVIDSYSMQPISKSPVPKFYKSIRYQ